MRSIGVGFALIVVLLTSALVSELSAEDRERPARLFFTSQGKTGIVRADGSDLRYFDLQAPNQATWQPGPMFPDGKRVVFLSMAPRRDGPGRPFEEYYTQTPTQIWSYQLDTGSLEELCFKDRIAPFETPALLIGGGRILVQVVKDKAARVVSMKLDGGDPRDFTRAGEGVPYGFSLSPDGKRVAFHIAGPQGYEVFTADPDGGGRVKLAGKPGHLYFGTSWSPQGDLVLYLDCVPEGDPGHDWADVCIGKPDGSEHRTLTSGGAMWFAATYGPADRHGSGSNLPSWRGDGTILFPRRTPSARTPWQYRAGKPDLDHFNRDFKPEEARGGVGISSLDPATGRIHDLTVATPGVWDFRASASPDGHWAAFCRARTGESPALCVIESSGAGLRVITKGIDDKGVDHPQWLPNEASPGSRAGR